jgi:hypothetical protein
VRTKALCTTGDTDIVVCTVLCNSARCIHFWTLLILLVSQKEGPREGVAIETEQDTAASGFR